MATRVSVPMVFDLTLPYERVALEDIAPPSYDERSMRRALTIMCKANDGMRARCAPLVGRVLPSGKVAIIDGQEAYWAARRLSLKAVPVHIQGRVEKARRTSGEGVMSFDFGDDWQEDEHPRAPKGASGKYKPGEFVPKGEPAVPGGPSAPGGPSDQANPSASGDSAPAQVKPAARGGQKKKTSVTPPVSPVPEEAKGDVSAAQGKDDLGGMGAWLDLAGYDSKEPVRESPDLVADVVYHEIGVRRSDVEDMYSPHVLRAIAGYGMYLLAKSGAIHQLGYDDVRSLVIPEEAKAVLSAARSGNDPIEAFKSALRKTDAQWNALQQEHMAWGRMPSLRNVKTGLDHDAEEVRKRYILRHLSKASALRDMLASGDSLEAHGIVPRNDVAEKALDGLAWKFMSRLTYASDWVDSVQSRVRFMTNPDEVKTVVEEANAGVSLDNLAARFGAPNGPGNNPVDTISSAAQLDQYLEQWGSPAVSFGSADEIRRAKAAQSALLSSISGEGRVSLRSKLGTFAAAEGRGMAMPESAKIALAGYDTHLISLLRNARPWIEAAFESGRNALLAIPGIDDDLRSIHESMKSGDDPYVGLRRANDDREMHVMQYERAYQNWGSLPDFVGGSDDDRKAAEEMRNRLIVEWMSGDGSALKGMAVPGSVSFDTRDVQIDGDARDRAYIGVAWANVCRLSKTEDWFRSRAEIERAVVENGPDADTFRAILDHVQDGKDIAAANVYWAGAKGVKAWGSGAGKSDWKPTGIWASHAYPLKVENGRLMVTTPYNKSFIQEIKRLDGRWDAANRRWVLPERRAEDVLNLIERIWPGLKPGAAKEVAKAVCRFIPSRGGRSSARRGRRTLLKALSLPSDEYHPRAHSTSSTRVKGHWRRDRGKRVWVRPYVADRERADHTPLALDLGVARQEHVALVRSARSSSLRGFHLASEEERKALRVPPAWTDVRIADDPTSPLQVTALDTKGRRQYRYSAEHSAARAREKFERVANLAQDAEDVFERIEQDIASPKSEHYEEALVLYLISLTGMRVGSDRDTKAAVKAYGASTLEPRHVTVQGDTLSFSFTGKKGVHIDLTLRNRLLARAVAARKRQGNERIFNTSDSLVRSYLKEIAGDYCVKDLRTLMANNIARKAVAKMPVPTTARAFSSARLAVAKSVAEQLGNTPTVALKSYINPEVFAKWERSVAENKQARDVSKRRK